MEGVDVMGFFGELFGGKKIDEKKYNEWLVQEPIREACRQTFKVGVLYSKQEVKIMLQQIYNNLGLVGKTAKATDLSAYLPVSEKLRSNTEGKRVFFIEVGGTNSPTSNK